MEADDVIMLAIGTDLCVILSDSNAVATSNTRTRDIIKPVFIN